jgi:4-hydroxybenzoate polyprenyltransferase
MDAARMTAETFSAPRPAPNSVFVEIGRFVRLSIVGFSLLLPLAGAAAVSERVSAGQLAALIAVGLAFHVFAYVSNDIFDLSIDRTEPLRAGSPLVRGLIRPSVALAIALVPVPVTAALHLWAGGPPAAAAALLTAMALMLIYNRYGKRVAFPLVSDAVQAIGWVALALYGAFATSAALTEPLGWLAAIVFVYVLLINGLHGGLRDIRNDAAHGARTTAIWFGAGADDEGRLLVPRSLARYGAALQLALFFLSVLSVRRWPLAMAMIVAAHVVLFFLGREALRADATKREVIRAGYRHLYLSLGVVLVPFALFGSAPVATAIVAVYAVPVVILALRMLRARSLLPLALLLAVSLGAEPVRVVTKEELVEAMRLQQGYAILATPNGARFNSGVILNLARAAHAADPNGPPLFIDHRTYFDAFVEVAGAAPIYVRMVRDYKEDQLVDYRRSKVIAAISGRNAVLAVNVISGWDGGKERYWYEDRQSKPPLRVRHERFTSYRLLEFDDQVQLIDDIQGVGGRPIGGVLGAIFARLGDAHAVRSFSTVGRNNVLITLTTARKLFPVTVAAYVLPDGTGDRGIPKGYEADLRRLRKPFEVTYVAIEKKSPDQRRK